MSHRKKQQAPAPVLLVSQKEPAARFSFCLSLSGIVGIGVVMFCLFLWMFLIGVWAGQTLLFPSRAEVAPPVAAPAAPQEELPKAAVASAAVEKVQTQLVPKTAILELEPQERKRRIISSSVQPQTAAR